MRLTFAQSILCTHTKFNNYEISNKRGDGRIPDDRDC